jgi:pimeloyl-ACP methyl ester carboxylesterase
VLQASLAGVGMLGAGNWFRKGSGVKDAAKHLPSDLHLLDWSWPKAKHGFEPRTVVLYPSKVPTASQAKWPVLLLIHGLGEAKEGPESGAYAWLNRYGAGSTYQRLSHPPLAAIEKRKDLTTHRAQQLSASLNMNPFRPMVLVCPYLPYIGSSTKLIENYSKFVFQELFPKVYQTLPHASRLPKNTGLDGCSYGAWIAMELFARKSKQFATLGVVQPALNESKLDAYVTMLASAHSSKSLQRVHIESSKYDVYKGRSQKLAEKLKAKGVPFDLTIPPCSHDQIFLRDVGTLEMMLWHNRNLSP